MPLQARHQTIAINNIAKLFSDLLNERESLLADGEELEGKLFCAQDELRQVEDILTTYTNRKKELVNEINGFVKRQDKIMETLNVLDDRISLIGDQTVKVEKTIRSIKGDSALLQNIEEEPAPNSCIKVFFR
jgi:predicted nuclease with TOPRIM domain